MTKSRLRKVFEASRKEVQEIEKIKIPDSGNLCYIQSFNLISLFFKFHFEMSLKSPSHRLRNQNQLRLSQ